jgi:hypothetical protein
MVSALVLSLWKNRKRLHLMDVILNSNLIDYNFIGCTGESNLLSFIENNPVDTIDIKTTSHIYTFDIKDLESFSDNSVCYTIKLKGGREICLL